jgi:TM2 domain-containing membrane protein YozV
MSSVQPSSGPQSAGAIQRDTRAMMRYDANKRSAGIAYLLWFFFGCFGAHRFYLKQTGTAVAMLVITILSIALTFVVIGLFGLAAIGIWVLVDAFLIPGLTRKYNNQLISEIGV